jgi:hypothetical protein
MHWSQWRLCQKIEESLSFPKLYYSMPINMFFIVKNHWEPSFTDNPRTLYQSVICVYVCTALCTLHEYLIIKIWKSRSSPCL